jgi:alkanesulfonate monooxygenase SsuD/methylene tetrahydromethanopterin reductase-like flavin-dependent oxidoreductase (luciferase family)
VRTGIVITPIHDRSVDPVTHVTEHEEAVSRAGELGFSTVFVGQHFLGSELRFYQPVPYLAHLAHFAPKARMATGIALLSLINPVEAAEQIATLDVVTRGRAVFGVGLGYSDAEFAAFGIDRRTRVGRFAEALELIRQLWSGDVVEFSGRHFELHGARPSVLPLQQQPPIWLGGQSEKAVRRAARLANAWYAAPFVCRRDLGALRQAYLDERTKHDLPLDGEFPLRRDIVIASTVEQARQLAFERSRQRYETYQKWGLDSTTAEQPTTDFARLDMTEIDERFILGPPGRCIEQIQELKDAVGVTELDIKVHWPGTSHREAMDQLEVFAAEVMPFV